LEELVHIARSHWQSLEKELKALQKADWDRHLAEEAAKSSRWLHSYTKPAEQQPLMAVVHRGESCSSLPHRLQAASDMWSALWKASEGPIGGFTMPGEADMLPAASAEDIRKVAASFGLQTSQRDGWHPRCFGFLCDEALSALGKLFRLAEALGRFPTAWQAVLIRLIPKPNSTDTRPIGLFPAIHRIWAKSRVPSQ
jgi:hypothetical protein